MGEAMADPAAVLAAEAGISETDAQKVLEAQARLAAGVPKIQTVQRDPSNGDVAVRVTRSGETGWWLVTQSDGSAVFDNTPDKGWPELFTPSGGA